MLQTIEGVIGAQDRVRLLENITLGKSKKALITILDEDESESAETSIELLDEDSESGSREISEMFNRSIENSGKELNS